MEFAKSNNALLPELDFFKLPSTQSSIVKSQYVEHRAVNQLNDGGPFNFLIPGGSDYVDLSRSNLGLKFKIVDKAGADIQAGTEVGVVNASLHTMWAQIDVYLNGVLVSTSSTNYPYSSMLKLLTENNNGVKKTRLTSEGYYKDTAGFMDDTRCKLGENIGLYVQFGLVEDSKVASFYGPLLADMMQLDRYLLPGVDIQIRLWPSKNDFALLKDTSTMEGAPFKIKIVDLYMDMLKITANPEIVTSQNAALTRQPALYPYERKRLQTYSVASGSMFFRQDLVFQTEVPDKLMVALVNSKAFNGDTSLNPFNFQNYDLREITVSIDDMPVPAQTYKVNFNSPGDYNKLYMNMFSMIGADKIQFDNDITIYDYGGGYAVMIFSPLAGIGAGNLSRVKRGNLRLEINFGTALPHAVTALCLGSFKDVFAITGSKQVLPRLH